MTCSRPVTRMWWPPSRRTTTMKDGWRAGVPSVDYLCSTKLVCSLHRAQPQSRLQTSVELKYSRGCKICEYSLRWSSRMHVGAGRVAGAWSARAADDHMPTTASGHGSGGHDAHKQAGRRYDSRIVSGQSPSCDGSQGCVLCSVHCPPRLPQDIIGPFPCNR